MWNRVLDSVFRKERNTDYLKYKEALENVVNTLTRVIEDDDAFEIISYGEVFNKAFKGE